MKFLSLLLLCSLFVSCNNDSSKSTEGKTDTSETSRSAKVFEEAVSYSVNGAEMKGMIAYDESIEGPRPVVLIVHEWWGLTEYPKMRARQLASLGYFAMAVDLYGEGKTAEDPAGAQKLATPFYTNPQMAKERLEAAWAKAVSYKQADTARTAAIGYCFGGTMVINAAKLGSPFDGVVSFHGTLDGPPPTKDIKSAFLICHGSADPMVPDAQVQAFRKSMDSVNANYTFKAYPGAQHAFTNPEATEKGKKFNIPVSYNAAADTASWNDMKAFFGQVLQSRQP